MAVITPIAPRRTAQAQPKIRSTARAAPASKEPVDDSLLKSLGRTAVSGLQYVGETLSKPSRALWGSIHGMGGLTDSGGGLLNLLPFSDALGLTDPAKAIELDKVLESVGAFPKNKEGFDAFDIPRLGAAIVGDPLTYVGGVGTLKALGRGGSVVAKAAPSINKLSRVARMRTPVSEAIKLAAPDVLSQTVRKQGFRGVADFVAQHGNEPTGGLFSLHSNPFGGSLKAVGTGELAQKVGGALDVAGAAARSFPPIRAIRGIFDPRVLGKFGKDSQNVAEAAYHARKAAKFPAEMSVLKMGREWDDLAKTFDEQIGEHVAKAYAAPDIDPREMEAAIGEVMAQRMAQWNDPAAIGERQFRSQFKHLIPQARKDVDEVTISPVFDTIADVYRNLTGNPHATTNDAFEALKRSDPKPTRSARDVVSEAEGLLSAGKQAAGGQGDFIELPFKQGEVVIAGDRGNYGYVQKSGARTSTVLFRNPETGNVAVKQLSNDSLTKAFPAGSKEAIEFSKLSVRKVFEDMMRAVAETKDPDEVSRLFLGDASKVSPELKARMSHVAATAQAGMDQVYASIAEYGGKANLHGVEQGFKTEHFPRYVSEKLAAEGKKINPSRAFPVSFGSMKARTPEIRDLPTHVVKELVTQNQYRNKDAAHSILQDFGEHLDDQWGRTADDFEFRDPIKAAADPATAAANRAKHAEALATWVADHPKEEMFANAAFEDWADYMRNAHRVEASLKAGHEYLAKEIAENAGEVPLKDVFRRAGLDEEQAGAKFEQMFGINPETAGVTPEAAQAFAGMLNLFGERWQHPITDAIDRFNRAFKSSVTVLFPSFFARNGVSGQFMNLSSGYIHSPAEAAKYAQQIGHARDLLKRAKSGGALSQQDQQWLDEIQAAGVIDKGHGFQDVETTLAPGTSWLPDDPRQVRQRASESRETVAGDPIGLDRVPGIPVARRAFGTATAVGSAVNQHVEWYNRVPMYLYLRETGHSAQAAAGIVEKLHFNYGDLAPAEREVFKRAFPFYCVPEDTEALTRRGWKRHSELVVGEEILTYSVERDALEWQPCLEVATFEHDQPLVHLSNSRHTLRFTENHRWAVERHAMKDGNRRYPAARKIAEWGDLNTNHSIIVTAELNETESILTDDQARLLGWLLTDAHYRERNGHFEATLYQTPQKFLEEVVQVAGKTEPGGYSGHSGCKTVSVRKDLLAPLRKYLGSSRHEGRILAWDVIGRLSTSALRAFWDAAHKADGLTVAHRKQDQIAAQDPHWRELLQVVAFMLGMRAQPTDRGLYVSHRRRLKIAGMTKTMVHYTGIVWCPRTDNSTWVMRQDGLVTVTGNTFQRKMTGLLAEQLLERPGGPVGQTIRMSGRQVSDEPMPESVTKGLSVPLGELPDGSKRVLTGVGLAHESPLEFVAAKNGVPDLGATFGEIGSQLNPIAKFAIETGTGRSLFQRRDLEDLDPTIGRTLTNIGDIAQKATGSRLGFREPHSTGRAKPFIGPITENFIANTPVSRLSTTARTLTDLRKYKATGGILDMVPGQAAAMNLLTGLRVTDVPVRVQEGIIKDAVADLSKQMGASRFETIRFTKDQIAAAEKSDPALGKRMRQLNAAATELVNRSKARKKAQQPKIRRPAAR